MPCKVPYFIILYKYKITSLVSFAKLSCIIYLFFVAGAVSALPCQMTDTKWAGRRLRCVSSETHENSQPHLCELLCEVP